MKTKTNSISKEARDFLLNLLEEAGIDLTSRIRERMLMDLAKRLDSKLTLAAFSALPTEKMDEFEDMISTDKSVLEVSKYLEENIPNINQVYAQALVEFKNNYSHSGIDLRQ